MKKLILAALFAASTFAAHAESNWLYMGDFHRPSDDQTTHLYIDAYNIQHIGNKLLVTSRKTYKYLEADADGKQSSELYEYDLVSCENHEIAAVRGAAYLDDRTVLDTGLVKPNKLNPVLPNTMGEMIYNAACRI